MRKYQIYTYQNDLFEKNILKKNNIQVISKEENDYLYKTVIFKEINNELKNNLIKEIKEYFIKINIKKNNHIFVVGLGRDYHTPDSVGPNTLKHLKVNAYLENLNLEINYPKVSCLKPGVLGETGILTENTIKSIVNEIKPDLVIIIDSFVSDNIEYLNHTIELNNQGINPGSGLFGIKSVINEKLLHTKILVIGVTTSLLVNIKDNNTNYLLSTKDIDNYVKIISQIIGQSLNSVIESLR